MVLQMHEVIGRALAEREVIDDEVLFGLRRLCAMLRSDGFTPARSPCAERLTPRQRQVLQMIAEGRTTRAMAVSLHLSVKTIESHRAKLMSQLGIRDVAGLVVYAIRSGIIDIDRVAPQKPD